MSENQNLNDKKASSNNSNLGCVAVIVFGTLLLFVMARDFDTGSDTDASNPGSGTTTSSQTSDALKLARVIEQAADGSAVCRVKSNTFTIQCTINAQDREADKIVAATVREVNALNVDLRGWKLTAVTLAGHTVTRYF